MPPNPTPIGSAVRLALATAVLGALAGCAGAPGAGSLEPAALTSEEQGLDCKRITGRMQIRILELRSRGSRSETSQLARNLQGATTTVIGGTSQGLDPNGQARGDIAKLEVLNRRLGELDCPTFDLAKDLAETDPLVSPRPVRPTTTAGKGT